MKTRPTTLEVLLALAGLVVGVPPTAFALMVVFPFLLYGSGIVLGCGGLYLYARRVMAKGWRGFLPDPIDPKEEAATSACVALNADPFPGAYAYRCSWAADFAREIEAIESRGRR